MPVDYIPRPNAKFNAFQKNIAQLAAANAAAWGIPPAEAATLTADSLQYETLFNTISTPDSRTRAQVHGHNTFRKTYEAALRQLVNRYLRGNKAISEQHLTDMGIKVRGKKRQQRPAIADAPVLVVESIPGTYVRILCRRQNHDGRASLHPDCDGIELRFALGDAASNFANMPHSFFGKKAHIRLATEPDWRGKTMSVCARWANLTHPTRSSAWSEVAVQQVY